MNIADYRREYTLGGLSLEDLNQDPIQQFELWFNQVCAVDKLHDANAMSLATVGADGKPAIRTVLLKSVDQDGFVFYTNYTSAKAAQMAENPQVALLFPWTELDRQIEVRGRVERLSDAENAEYIRSRPKGSQLGAWASYQSRVISDRQVLDNRLAELETKFAEETIPIPDFWGGYRVIPETIEFWQGGKNRLHDRFEYRILDNKWSISCLSP